MGRYPNRKAGTTKFTQSVGVWDPCVVAQGGQSDLMAGEFCRATQTPPPSLLTEAVRVLHPELQCLLSVTTHLFPIQSPNTSTDFADNRVFASLDKLDHLK